MPRGVYKRTKEHIKNWRKSMNGYVHSEETKSKIGNANRKEKSGSWKGTKATYNSLHSWIRKAFGRPRKCEECGTTKAKLFDWANISGLYLRERSDYRRLCRACHIKFDKGGRNKVYALTWKQRMDRVL